MRSLYQKVFSWISSHKLFLLIVLFISVSILIGLFSYFVLVKNNHTEFGSEKSPNFDGNIILLTLTYYPNQKETVKITNISIKPTQLSPSSILNTNGENEDKNNSRITIELIDGTGKIIATKKYNLRTEIIADSFSASTGIVTGESIRNENISQTITVPSYETLRKIIIRNHSGEEITRIDYKSLPNSNSNQSIQQASPESISIAFIPYNYTQSEMSEYKRAVNNSLNTIKTVPPWSEASHVNYPIYESVIPELSCSQEPTVRSYCLRCNWDAAIAALSKQNISAKHIVLVGKEATKGGACAPGTNATIPSNEMFRSPATLVHELGHAIANLHHEYPTEAYDSNVNGELSSGPITNTVDRNCLKGNPPTSAWSEIILPNSYYKGCGEYTNWYRSGRINVMGSNVLNFSPVGLWIMREALGLENTPISDPEESPGEDLGECVVLEESINVTKSTKFCSGTKTINNGEDGVITVSADNIIIDGNELILDGGSKMGYGIVLNGHSNVTIRNFTIRNYKYAIFVSNATGVKIENNNMSGNATTSVGSSGQFGINASITETPGGGILADNLEGGSVIENTGSNQAVGLNLYNSSGNTISGNDFSNNNAWGIRLFGSSNNTISSNEAHHVNPCSGHCDSAGILLVKGSNGNTISHNNLIYSGDGFFIGNEAGSPSNNNTISWNDASHSPHNCFEATFSTGNKFLNNKATNCGYGFWLGFSNADVSGNTITNNSEAGVAWQSGNWNPPGDWRSGNKPGAVTNNVIKNNGRGIDMENGNGVFPVANLSSFPAQNSFANNKNGNCVGPGFTEADKAGGKCPNGENGQTPNSDPGAPIGEPGGGSEPVLRAGPISGTILVLSSETITSQVKITVNNKEYTGEKTANNTWKYTTETLPAGKYMVTAKATLQAETLSASSEFNSDTKNADLTISAWNEDIIEEKCGSSGVAEGLFGSYQLSACLQNPPTTLDQAEQGKFDANEAAKTKDQGNKYCGKNGFDVYKCKNGNIEVIELGSEICSKLPWCPKDSSEAFKPDPCGSPDNRPEKCACQKPTSSRQSNCANNLICTEHKNSQQHPGYACCPEGKSLCPLTRTCMGVDETCGAGIATATPLPTQFQFLGCPDNNSDGSHNICSSKNSGQPTDGVRNNGTVLYDNTKTYTRNQNGDAVCESHYAGTPHAGKKYCWKESGAAITPHPNGCPNPNGKSKCVAEDDTCPNGTYDSNDSSRGKACSLAVPGTGKCCVENGINLASSQIASSDKNSCKTSRDCTEKKLGNICMYLGRSQTGVCRTY